MRVIKVSSIRGIYWDSDRGLFLIKTEKSKPNWTTPGGKSSYSLDHADYLRERIFKETGLTPQRIESNPIIHPHSFIQRASNPGKMIEVTVYFYCIDLQVPPIERLGGSCTDYAFLDLERLREQSGLLTATTKRIVNHQEFIQKAKRGRLI